MIHAVIGHGRSPEGRGWGRRIDAADTVVRLWNWHWQAATDYGERYDYGFLEGSPSSIATFDKYRRRTPRLGWIATVSKARRMSLLPPRCSMVDQVRWTDVALKMGGVGRSGALRFTRGTIAACWTIERASPGDTVVLVGFDNIHAGTALPVEQAFSPEYLDCPGTLQPRAYTTGTKAGNHDYAIERPFMERLSAERGETLAFAQDIWRSGPRALVLGDAGCVHEDAAAALAMFRPDAVAATNNMGIEWPGRLDYWMTLHPDRCPHWPGIVEAKRQRLAKGYNRPQIWGHKSHQGIDRYTDDWRGSTGLLTVKALLEEGFTRIVLAGVPMSRFDGYFYEQKGAISIENYRPGWTKHHKQLAPFVRSMSGWTRSQLGEPDAVWLAS